MRLCDGCGIKVPRFRPRNNQNGRMLCDGCAEGRPGGEGRPIGYHGMVRTAAPYDKGNRAGREDAKAGRPKQDIPVRDENGDPSYHAGYMNGYNFWMRDNATDEDYAAFRDSEGRPITGSLKVAHDSGDGETIYHCPFCGGGQVTAGSDGSVECGFCHTLFTVQVQPEHAAMPQTINGVPQQMPGMPGEVGGDPNPVGAPPPGGDTGVDHFVPPDAFAPPEAPAAPGAPPAAPAMAARHAKSFEGDEQVADEKACDHFEQSAEFGEGTCANCLWAIGAHSAKAGGPDGHGGFGTTAFYVNANGVALPEESYMRHLAIAFADDPFEVIQQVRGERTAAVPTLPPGWRVEMLGLINGVQFSHKDNGRSLLWVDGRWTRGPGANPAPGVPYAATAADARRVGSEFIQMVESEVDA